MKRLMVLVAVLFSVTAYSQTSYSENVFEEIPPLSNNELKTDGIIQPYLDEFLKLCDDYGIDYHKKLFKLKEIALVDTLKMSKTGGTLGLQVRNKKNEVEKIVFSWVTLIDKDILKVVAFHEFGHYFLGYNHICYDCNKIMAEVNTSYYAILKDWDYQVKRLFMESPLYLRQGIAHINTKPKLPKH